MKHEGPRNPMPRSDAACPLLFVGILPRRHTFRVEACRLDLQAQVFQRHALQLRHGVLSHATHKCVPRECSAHDAGSHTTRTAGPLPCRGLGAPMLRQLRPTSGPEERSERQAMAHNGCRCGSCVAQWSTRSELFPSAAWGEWSVRGPGFGEGEVFEAPSRGSRLAWRISLTRPVSMTTLTSGMVTEVSAMLVDSTILTVLAGNTWNARRWVAGGSAEWRGATTKRRWAVSVET